MGASHLQPVITRHTQVTRVNLDRMRANVIEAARAMRHFVGTRCRRALPTFEEIMGLIPTACWYFATKHVPK